MRHAGSLRVPGRADQGAQGGREQPAQPCRSGPGQPVRGQRPRALALRPRPGRALRQPGVHRQRPRLGQRLHRAPDGARHHPADGQADLSGQRRQTAGHELAHRRGPFGQHPARERQRQHLHRAAGERQRAGGHLQRAAGHHQLPPRAASGGRHRLRAAADGRRREGLRGQRHRRRVPRRFQHRYRQRHRPDEPLAPGERAVR